MTGSSDVIAQDLIKRACETYASRPLVTHNEKTWTYQEMWERGGQLAAALEARGINSGDCVGLMMANQPDYFTGVFACVRGGYCIVPMNDMLTEDEFLYMISNSGTRAVLVGPQLTETLANIESELPQLDVQISISEPIDKQESLDELLNSTKDIYNKIDGDDLLMLPYTGGTTGRPKGVRHTHAKFAMDMLAHVTELDIQDAEEMLFMTPLPHAAGYMAFAGLIQGAHFTVTTGFDPGEFLSLINEGEISWTFLVPSQIYRILDHNSIKETDVSGLETVVYGAAPITPERLAEALDMFGQVFIQLYGQTEMPDIGTILPKSDHVMRENQVDSCGKPAAMVDVRIANPKEHTNTTALQRGEEGELLMRSPYVMERYHDRPEATEKTLVDGWLRTGDIARRDDEGYVYLLDRASDMIISGGMNIYTTEVEDTLDRYPSARQVAVIGIPDDDWGEAVHAVIVPEDDVEDELTTEAIREFADEHLADYKKPKSVEFVEEIPTTPYGKMDKKALREPYWEETSREIN